MSLWTLPAGIQFVVLVLAVKWHVQMVQIYRGHYRPYRSTMIGVGWVFGAAVSIVAWATWLIAWALFLR
jgi:hypothetical protein